jgi:hypothetical protein
MRKLILILCLLAGVVWAADELSVTEGWIYSKNGRSRVMSATTLKADIAGNGVIENVQAIPTNDPGTVLVLGGVTNAGFAWFKNISTTNGYVEIGGLESNGCFIAFLKLNTNECQTCWLAITNPRARANGRTMNLDYVIIDR